MYPIFCVSFSAIPKSSNFVRYRKRSPQPFESGSDHSDQTDPHSTFIASEWPNWRKDCLSSDWECHLSTETGHLVRPLDPMTVKGVIDAVSRPIAHFEWCSEKNNSQLSLIVTYNCHICLPLWMKKSCSTCLYFMPFVEEVRR